MTGYVYFIKPVGEAGPIKVGYSVYPPERLAAFQSWSPVELELIASVAGSLKLEAAIHSHFADYQIRGEWFEPVDALRKLAYQARDGLAIDHAFDLSGPVRRLNRRKAKQNPVALSVGLYKRRVESARQFASTVAGRVVHVPDEVSEILRDAGGYRKEYRPLTDAEKSRLERFIESARAPTPETAA